MTFEQFGNTILLLMFVGLLVYLYIAYMNGTDLRRKFLMIAFGVLFLGYAAELIRYGMEYVVTETLMMFVALALLNACYSEWERMV